MDTKGLLLCVLLSSLLSNSANAQSSNTLRNVRGGADEAAALSHSKFATPIILHVDSDGFSQAQRLTAMNGVDNEPTYGAIYKATSYSPCYSQRNYSGPPHLNADIVNYSGKASYNGIVSYTYNDYTMNPVRSRWLYDNRFFQVETRNIRYPNASKPESFGGEDTYVCKIINDNVAKYLPPNQATNVHNGLDIPIGRRVLTKWTFRNRYDTPIPGKGNVKVFAGTFTYRIHPLVPIVAFPGEGTATVKLYFDPDDGRWTIDNWQMKDPPGITLLTNPLPVNAKVSPHQGEAGTPMAAAGAPVGQGDCMVILIDESSMAIVSSYKGGCKDGLAEGHGSYTYSIKHSDGSKDVVLSAKGEFHRGKFHGTVTITGENNDFTGEYREGLYIGPRGR